jgi:Na+-driven multidrug efflux pump
MQLKYTLFILALLLTISNTISCISSYNMGKNDFDKSSANYQTDKLYLQIGIVTSIIFIILIIYFTLSNISSPVSNRFQIPT